MKHEMIEEFGIFFDGGGWENKRSMNDI